MHDCFRSWKHVSSAPLLSWLERSKENELSLRRHLRNGALNDLYGTICGMGMGLKQNMYTLRRIWNVSSQNIVLVILKLQPCLITY